jgi:hypothetical protein
MKTTALIIIALFFTAGPAFAEEAGIERARRCVELTQSGHVDEARVVCNDPAARARLVDIAVAMAATASQQAQDEPEQLLAEEPPRR